MDVKLDEFDDDNKGNSPECKKYTARKEQGNSMRVIHSSAGACGSCECNVGR